jgi:alpha-L-fucosidase
MDMKRLGLAMLSTLFLIPLFASAQAAPASDPSTQPIPQWWSDARFGMFIHWGPVSIKGTEIGWSRDGERPGLKAGKGEVPVEVYDNLYKEFNPVEFDAKAWVKLAQDAGMKYMVFTTKHHDGFCEFDSKYTDYKITNSPFKRDIVAELTAACHEAGMPIGYYYSPPDWHHPDYRRENGARYTEYFHNQVRELLSNYGTIDIIWFDGLNGNAQEYQAEDMIKDIRRLQPGIVINNRLGLPADHDTPEQTIGRFQRSRPWESCITICQQWAWKPDDKMKTLDECLSTLVRCAGGDGNLLFNVGPMPTGQIEPRQQERLREMGAWLKKNGETIYGTRGGPWRPGKWGACTAKGSTVFVHCLAKETEVIDLPVIPCKITGFKALSGGDVKVTQNDKGEVRIALDKNSMDPLDTIVAIDFDKPVADLEITEQPSGSLVHGKPATASNVFGKMNDQYGPEKALDDDPETRWATNAGVGEAWLEVDLGAPVRIGQVAIVEAIRRVQDFAVEAFLDGAWKPVLEGKHIGDAFEATFDPVTTNKVRLHVLKATDGPTFYEFQVFPPK